MLDHQDKYMMKAQVHVSKSSAISDIQALPQRKYFLLSSGDDVSNFTIALRMFTKSLVIHKIKKRDPYTPYQDPQGFIYVDDSGRNRLIRSDELYKFSDGTLTRLRTSLAKRKKDDEESQKFIVEGTTELTSGYFNEQYDLIISCSSS
nr:hypothetical protein [Tanacetum cinerariifolium]